MLKLLQPVLEISDTLFGTKTESTRRISINYN